MASTGVSITTPVLKRVSSWDVQTVDDGGENEDNVGQHTSIAFDPADGYPAVAYYNVSDGDLKYAKWDGSSWNPETVDDGNCDDVGKWASLLFTGSGEPAIAYYDETNTNLKFAWYHEVGGRTQWYISTLDGTNKDVGKYISLSAVGYGNLGISYYDDTNDGNSLGRLLYIEYSNGSWGAPVEVDDPADGDVGKYTSLHPDPNNSYYPAISYYDETNGDVKYAYYDGSDWNTETAYTGGNDDVGLWSSLDFDIEGNPSIAFYNASDTDPGWVWDEDGQGWDFYSLGESEDTIGQYITHHWKSSTAVGFAFYHAADHELVYLVYYPVTLQTSSVAVSEGNDDVGKWVDFKYKSSNDPRFSFYNDTDNDAKYAEWVE